MIIFKLFKNTITFNFLCLYYCIQSLFGISSLDLLKAFRSFLHILKKFEILVKKMSSKLIAERYQKIQMLNDGTYGIVWLCNDIQTNQKVALKEIQSCDSNVSIKEIKSLQALHHPNIINLLDCFRIMPNDYIVLEYGGDDLLTIMEANPRPFKQNQIKKYMHDILSAVSYIHSAGYIHRDIKPANILIDDNDNLKLIDFGLCRPLNGDPLSPLCCTYQYTPLDCLLGAPSYNQEFDIWSVGCVFAELFTGKILFDGESQLSIVLQILKILGTPKEEDWPEMDSIPYCQNFNIPKFDPTIKEVLKDAPPEAVDLILKMLCISESKRISAADALQHPYFTSS